jgi:hypothetical protein
MRVRFSGLWHRVVGSQEAQWTGCLLTLRAGVKRQAGERTVMVHTLADAFCLFQKSPQWLKFECAPNRVKLCERGIALPSHSEISLVVTTRCWLQLCTVSANLVNYLASPILIFYLISDFRCVLNVIFFLLVDSPASEFYVPTFRNTACSLFLARVNKMKMEQTECSEMSAHKINTPGNRPKEVI